MAEKAEKAEKEPRSAGVYRWIAEFAGRRGWWGLQEWAMQHHRRVTGKDYEVR